MANNDYNHGFTVPPSVPSLDYDRGGDSRTEYDDHGFGSRTGTTSTGSTSSSSTIPESNTTFGKTEVIELPKTPTRAEEKTRFAVVGWVVGITGNCQGIDYRLHVNQNTIGRGEDVDVDLMDQRISRVSAVDIFYDPLGVKYYARVGGGKCLAYVNKELLMGDRLLQPYDRIQLAVDNLGSAEIVCELLFVPLCGDHFSWKEVNEKSEKTEG